MIELGFEPDIPLDVIKAGKIPGEYLFKRPGTLQIVELHTERTFRYYPRAMPLETLLARQRRVPLDGREIPALSLEDEFVLNAIHGAKHFWERLMWVADIAAIVVRHPEIDWAKVRQSAEVVGAGRMLRVALQLAAILLQVPMPEQMAEEVRSDSTASHLCSQVARWLPGAGYDPPVLKERAIFRMRMRGGLAGAAYLLRLSFFLPKKIGWKGAEGQRSGFWDSINAPATPFSKIPFQRLIEAEPPWFATSQRPGHSTTLRGSSAHYVREFLSSRAPVVAHPLTIRSYSATNLLLVTSLRLSLSSLAGVLELGECAFHPRW